MQHFNILKRWFISTLLSEEDMSNTNQTYFVMNTENIKPLYSFGAKEFKYANITSGVKDMKMLVQFFVAI